MRGRRAVAALAVLALLAGCQPPAGDPPAPAAVGWRRCAMGECTEVSVPLDHDDPRGERITLAVARRPAQGESLGTIFIHPGGPGVSGRAAVSGFARRGLERYDLVGWDPRGVEASGAVACAPDAQVDAYRALDASPDDAAERSALLAATARLAQGCRESSGRLLDHLSLADNARDLEVLRARLTDRPLLFVGSSYGTAVGAVYAELFGDRVGRLVLDGAMDVNPPREPQVLGFERALDRAGLTDAAARLLAALERAPLDVAGRSLTSSLAATGIAAHLYRGRHGWTDLAAALRDAEAGDGTALLAAADALEGRRPDGSYSSLFAGFRASYCADAARPSAEEADAEWAAVRAAAPVLGEAFGPSYTCVGWPGTPAAPHLVRGQAVRSPVLVIGVTGDPATPFAWAEALATDLATGTLVTVEAEGHTGYGRGIACLDDLVVRHLSDPGFTLAPVRC